MEQKSVGNLLFKQAKYAEALDKYREGVSALNAPADGEDESVILLNAQLHYNASTCLFKLDRLAETLEEVQRTLEIVPHYVKAMFRRAQVYEIFALRDQEKGGDGIEHLTLSLEALLNALHEEPENNQVVGMIKNVRGQLEVQKKQTADVRVQLEKVFELRGSQDEQKFSDRWYNSLRQALSLFFVNSGKASVVQFACLEHDLQLYLFRLLVSPEIQVVENRKALLLVMRGFREVCKSVSALEKAVASGALPVKRIRFAPQSVYTEGFPIVVAMLQHVLQELCEEKQPEPNHRMVLLRELTTTLTAMCSVADFASSRLWDAVVEIMLVMLHPQLIYDDNAEESKRYVPSISMTNVSYEPHTTARMEVALNALRKLSSSASSSSKTAEFLEKLLPHLISADVLKCQATYPALASTAATAFKNFGAGGSSSSSSSSSSASGNTEVREVSETEQREIRMQELCARLMVVPLLSGKAERMIDALDGIALMLQAHFPTGMWLLNYNKIRRPGYSQEEAELDQVNAKLAAPLMTIVECAVPSNRNRALQRASLGVLALASSDKAVMNCLLSNELQVELAGLVIRFNATRTKSEGPVAHVAAKLPLECNALVMVAKVVASQDLSAILAHGGASTEASEDSRTRLAFDLMLYLFGSMQLIEKELGIGTSEDNKEKKKATTAAVAVDEYTQDSLQSSFRLLVEALSFLTMHIECKRLLVTHDGGRLAKYLIQLVLKSGNADVSDFYRDRAVLFGLTRVLFNVCDSFHDTERARNSSDVSQMQDFAKMKLAEQNGNVDVAKDKERALRRMGGIYAIQPLKRRLVELGGISAARFLVSFFTEAEQTHRDFADSLMRRGRNSDAAQMQSPFSLTVMAHLAGMLLRTVSEIRQTPAPSDVERIAELGNPERKEEMGVVEMDLKKTRSMRGMLVQQGGLKVLCKLFEAAGERADEKSNKEAAEHVQFECEVALARVLLTTDPNHIPSQSVLSRCVAPLRALVQTAPHESYQHEAALSLTNLASMGPEVQTWIFNKGGFESFQALATSENPRLQQAGVEGMCNMVYCAQVQEVLNQNRGSSIIEVFLMFSIDEEHYATQRAAIGALAMISVEGPICRAVLQHKYKSYIEDPESGNRVHITRSGLSIIRNLRFKQERKGLWQGREEMITRMDMLWKNASDILPSMETDLSSSQAQRDFVEVDFGDVSAATLETAARQGAQ